MKDEIDVVSEDLRFLDSYKNAVAGLGTAESKAYHNSYSIRNLSDNDLQVMYRESWLAKKIVNIPAGDATRNWRSWNREDADDIQKAEIAFGIQKKVYKAMRMGRLYGGAALLIGANVSRPEEPIIPEQMSIGDLKYVTVLPKTYISGVETDQDVTSETFLQPKAYRVNNQDNPTAEIHPSRVIIFDGADIPDHTLNTDMPWGDSVLQCAWSAVTDTDATMANVAALIFEAKLDIIKIPGLMQGVQDKRYEELILTRFALANKSKAINGVLLLDSEEEHDTRQLQFSALPQVMDRFFQAVSGAADIPMTRLFGESPAGLNATGESDLQNYYDSLGTLQVVDIGPKLSILDKCIYANTYGNLDGYGYTWNPIRQMSDKDRAEANLQNARCLRLLQQTNLFEHNSMASTSVNVLGSGNNVSFNDLKPAPEGQLPSDHVEVTESEDNDENGSTSNPEK